MNNEFFTNVFIQGNTVFYRGVKDGKRTKKKIAFKPTLYLPDAKGDWTTLEGYPLEPKTFASIYDAKAFVRKYDDVDNFKIYGNQRFQYTFIGETFPGAIAYDLAHIRIATIDIEVRSANGLPDPETAVEEITSIAMKIGGTIHVFSTKEFKTSRSDIRIKFTHCQDEGQLLNEFIDCWSEDHPDIVTGWNSKMFDIPYLVNRITNMLGPNRASKLSPWGQVEVDMINIGFKEVLGFVIKGVQQLDYFDLYKKFAPTPNQESYKLDFIAEVELKENKIDWKSMGYKDLEDLWERNPQLYIEYNIVDVELVDKLEKKLALIVLAITMAMMNKVNYEDVFKQGRMWDAIIYNYMKAKKIAVPPTKESSGKYEKFVGAYVKEPPIGRHRWIASFDLTSLYPHLIMMYNMSPETFIEPEDYDDACDEFMKNNRGKINVESLLAKKFDLGFLKESKVALTPNAQFFRTDKRGILAEIMDDMFGERNKFKKKEIATKKEAEVEADPTKKAQLKSDASQYKAFQMALKVTLNSAYGSIGNQYFRFFDVRVAEAVTLSGQLSIRWIQQEINAYFNRLLKTQKEDYVLASDTDSIYLSMERMVIKLVEDRSDGKKVTELMDKICEQKLMPFIDKSYQDLANYVNAYAQKMVMKREALADQVIWVGKKNYITSIYDLEGVSYSTPEVKITGWGSARSDKPKICRNKLKETMKVVLYKDVKALKEMVEAFQKEFNNQPLIKIASPVGLNDMEKWADAREIYQKGAPVHVKAALFYNHYIRSNGLEKKYAELRSRNKIQYIYLKTPNPFQSPVIGFQDEIPPEMELEKYVDYNAQFNKTFLDPLKLVLTAVDWSIEDHNSLEDFFS